MKKFVTINLIVMSLLGCSKDAALPTTPILGLGGDDRVKTELDFYLYQQFTIPYNIEIKYKWDPYEVNFNKNLVPPDEAKVVPVMETVKKIWMDAYEKAGGETFLRKYRLMKYVLVGSPEYQDNGTVILGLAEGGTSIILFDVNDFDRKNKTQVTRMMHTIHHEFAHILHQTTPYPQSWRGLSSAWYTATWFNSTDKLAQEQGLISAYAKASEREDFVETVSFLLTEGQQAFDEIVNANPDGGIVLRKKETLIVEYFRTLGIDFRQLQNQVQTGITQIVNGE